MTRTHGGPRDIALLSAHRQDGTEIEHLEIPLATYYEQRHPMLDSNDYRASRGITVIEGRLFDDAGTLSQEFRNRYERDGAYMGGRVVHADGTVHEDQ